MSGKQKAILIVVLGLIVVLFIVAMGGRNSEDGDPNARNGFVDWLGDLGGGAGAVTAAEVTADCKTPDGRLKFTGGCVLHVQPDGDGMRLLTLRSTKPFFVKAKAPGDGDVTMEDTVAPSPPSPEATAKVAVEGPSEVELVCPGGPGAECLILIGPKE